MPAHPPRSRLRSRLRRTAAVVALALLAGAGAQAAEAATPTPPVLASVAVPSCPADGLAVPADYLGLSIEWGMVARWFGTSRTAVVPAMVQVLRSLSATPGVLRIGGNSEDGFTWSQDGDISGNGAFTGTINAGMVDALFEVARQSGWRVILGLNLKADDPAGAAALARYVRTVDTDQRLLAFEIGNEPNAYFGSDPTSYVARVQRYVDVLDADPATAGAPITGPAISNQADVAYVSAFTAAFRSRMPFVAWHAYANRPTLTDLLDEGVASDWRARMADVASAAGGVPSRMTEGNSVGNGGLDRVSSVMGSTAWLVDTLLTGAASGLAGFNLHSWDGVGFPTSTPTAYYTPYVIRDGLVLPSPVLYGMALLRNLPGSRFCRTTNRVAPTQSVKAWSAADPSGRHVYVYVVNKGVPGHEGTVSVAAPPGAYGTVTVNRIQDDLGCAGRSTSIEQAQMPRSGLLSWVGRGVTPVPGSSTYRVYLGACQSAVLDFRRQAPVTPRRTWSARR